MGCSPSSEKNHNNEGKIPSTSKLKLVLETWKFVYSHKNHVAIILIQRFICSDNDVRRVFERSFSQNSIDQMFQWNIDDVHKHGIVVLDTIDTALRMIDDLENLNQVLFELGKRHATYGVKERMLTKLWETLASTLKTILRDAFTKDVKDAWYDVFGFLAARFAYGLKMAIKGPTA